MEREVSRAMQWRLVLPQASLAVQSGLARMKSSGPRLGGPCAGFAAHVLPGNRRRGWKAETGCVRSREPGPVVGSTAPDSKGKFSKLAKRVSFGALLGGLGLLVILSGGVLYSCFAAAAAYQTTTEFSGLVATMGSRKREMAPPSSISDLMSVFCVFFPLMAYFYPTGGKPALMLTLAAFLLLSMEVLTVEKPNFSQLTAAVFGLFYCGECKNVPPLSISCAWLETDEFHTCGV